MRPMLPPNKSVSLTLYKITSDLISYNKPTRKLMNQIAFKYKLEWEEKIGGLNLIANS